jgi:hypothetical protein
MVYKEIHTAAFVPTVGTDSLPIDLRTLTFPEHWRHAVLDFYARTRSEKGRSKVLEHQSVPIGRLNALLRAVAPGLVSVGSRAPTHADLPWLYSEDEFDAGVLVRYVGAWLEDMAPKDQKGGRSVAGAYRPMLQALQEMDPAEVRWETTAVDLLKGRLSEGGTLVPDKRLYRLLPEYAAARLAGAGPYRFAGEEVRWHRVACDDGAELVSDVLSYTPRNKDRIGKPWYYSGVLRFQLRTEPFSEVPRLHVRSGIRRWTSGKANLQGGRGSMAYLRADATLLPDAPAPDRLAAALVKWDPGTGRPEWRLGGPMGMLRRIAVTDHFPDPESLVQDGTQRMTVGRAPGAALVHHTTMGVHKVLPGLMPEERRRLMTWVADALGPEFTPAPVLRRVGLPRRTPVVERYLEKRKKGETASSDRDAQRRREHLSRVLQGADLSAVVLYQNKETRDALIRTAEESLDLAGHREHEGPDIWVWRSPELTVRLTAHPAGEAASPMGDGTPPRKGREFLDACAERRRFVKETVQKILAETGVDAQVVYVELAGAWTATERKGFRSTEDPKGAIRAGVAEAGLVSQFMRPYAPDAEDTAMSVPHRITSAWGDGLRQLGATMVPRPAKEGGVPRGLTQIAFWMVRRNVTGRGGFPQFTPVALLSRGQERILGRTPQNTGWVPYPELLRELTGQVATEHTEEAQTAAAAGFVRTTIARFKAMDTLVILHAQNSRNRWPWLGNGELVPDRVKLGHGPLQRLSVLGGRTRVVRVASAERAEVPQWWARKEGAAAGFTRGLWRAENDTSERVFYSTGDKPGSAKTSKEATKLTSHTVETTDKEGRPAVRDHHAPASLVVVPQLVQFTFAGLLPEDDPLAWAEFLHQQRDGDDYREDLALPVLMHLAAKCNEYAIPYEGEETATVVDLGGDEEPQQMALF